MGLLPHLRVITRSGLHTPFPLMTAKGAMTTKTTFNSVLPPSERGVSHFSPTHPSSSPSLLKSVHCSPRPVSAFAGRGFPERRWHRFRSCPPPQCGLVQHTAGPVGGSWRTFQGLGTRKWPLSRRWFRHQHFLVVTVLARHLDLLFHLFVMMHPVVEAAPRSVLSRSGLAQTTSSQL